MLKNIFFIFDKKCVGLHFGRFFLKLIWSPCSKNETDRNVPKKRSHSKKARKKAREGFCQFQGPGMKGKRPHFMV
jgi:hypothetical protein